MIRFAAQAHKGRGVRVRRIDPTEVVRLVLAGQVPAPAWIPHITELHLERTGITDLRPLTALTSLRRLVISHTLVSDITPLAALTGLRRLEATRSRVADVTALASLTRTAKSASVVHAGARSATARRVGPT